MIYMSVAYEIVSSCRFVEEYYNEPNRGYGRYVTSVFTGLKEENCQNPYGPAERHFYDNGSHGNGGAMRISPAALFSIKRKQEAGVNIAGCQTKIRNT